MFESNALSNIFDVIYGGCDALVRTLLGFYTFGYIVLRILLYEAMLQEMFLLSGVN